MHSGSVDVVVVDDVVVDVVEVVGASVVVVVGVVVVDVVVASVVVVVVIERTETSSVNFNPICFSSIVVVVVGGSPETVQGIPSFTEYMDVSV